MDLGVNKKTLAEGFATILVAAFIGALLTWMGSTGTNVTNTPVPGLIHDATNIFLITVVIGVILMSVVFLLVEAITSDLSAMMVLIIAVLIMWILQGGLGVTSLLVSVGLVFVGNMVAKYFELDKKIHKIIQ